MQQLEQRLDSLLSRDLSTVENHLQESLGALLQDPGPSFVLFGVRSWPAKHAVAGLRRLGIEPIAFADNDPTLWHTRVDGVQILPPEEAVALFGKKAAFVITIYNGSSVREQLHQMNCPKVVSFEMLFHRFPETFLPYLGLDVPSGIFKQASDVRRALALWADDLSRQEYVAQLTYGASLDHTCLPSPSDPSHTYFPPELVKKTANETFVDCGAFEGDTIRRYLEHCGSVFHRIIAFEPDPGNFLRLEAYVSTLPGSLREKIVIRQAAVTRQGQKVLLDFTGSAASTILGTDGSGTETSNVRKTTPHTESKGEIRVDGICLDESVPEDGPSYVKMDIEGGELDALHGASRLMSRSRSVWAVAMYHRQDDLWRIPLFIRSLSDEYRLFLRRYAEGFAETVCYAIPSDRMAVGWQ
jgi:FkbM family methyltransferase